MAALESFLLNLNGGVRYSEAGHLYEEATMRVLIQDLRLAVRLSLKSPTFTAVTLLALALGVSANTVIFSAFNAVLLRPLPYNDPERVVTVWDSFPKLGVRKIGVTYANFADLKQRARSFDPLALYTAGSTTGFNLTGLGGPNVCRPRARPATSSARSASPLSTAAL